MNINDYIEKYSEVSIDKELGKVTVEVTVPMRKSITFKHEECDESQDMRVYDEDVKCFLKDKKGVDITATVKSSSIINGHPAGLTGLWEFKIQPQVRKKQYKRSKSKNTQRENKNTEEV